MSLKYLFIAPMLAMLLPNTAYAQSAYSKWAFRHQVDAMTDEVQVAAVMSYRSDSVAFSCWPQNPEYGVVVTFAPDIYIPSLKTKKLINFAWVEAQMRFDEGPVTRGLFKPESGNLQFLNYLADPEEKIGSPQYKSHLMEFLEQLGSARVWRIRMQQNDGMSANWWFDLTGSRAALTKLRNLCSASWPTE